MLLNVLELILGLLSSLIGLGVIVFIFVLFVKLVLAVIRWLNSQADKNIKK